MTILILGGTYEARVLAEKLKAVGASAITSLAGRTEHRVEIPGGLRIGGFGGSRGLEKYLVENQISKVVDATHPFAPAITANAELATTAASVPLVRLQRPQWQSQAGDCWHRVTHVAEAAAALGQFGDRVFLTIGRQGVSHFAMSGQWFLIRCIDPPSPPLPDRHEVLCVRGPFTVSDELALLREQRIDVVVTKNSGGEAAVAKLTAARELGLPVVVVERPTLPKGIDTVDSVDAALDWLSV